MFVLIILLLVTIALLFVPGLALLAVIPALVLIIYAAWLVFASATGRTPGTVVRQRGQRGHRLLGPGGPDDPDA
ncbi:MAG TPA: hypothetical protein VFW85_08715 [Gaiellaceae bacterium]|nr:hypothetical protein [Gaiellaceae bacterium]